MPAVHRRLSEMNSSQAGLWRSWGPRRGETTGFRLTAYTQCLPLTFQTIISLRSVRGSVIKINATHNTSVSTRHIPKVLKVPNLEVRCNGKIWQLAFALSRRSYEDAGLWARKASLIEESFGFPEHLRTAQRLAPLPFPIVPVDILDFRYLPEFRDGFFAAVPRATRTRTRRDTC